jgi:hypothetical protein
LGAPTTLPVDPAGDGLIVVIIIPISLAAVDKLLIVKLAVACADVADDSAEAIAAVAVETFTEGATEEIKVFSELVAVIANKDASAAFFAVSAALNPRPDISSFVQELAAAQIVLPSLTTPTITTFDATTKSAAAVDAAV